MFAVRTVIGNFGRLQAERSPVEHRSRLKQRALIARLFLLALVCLISCFFPQTVHAQRASGMSIRSAASTFEKGLVYPRYSPWSYGPDDQTWQGSLPIIKAQTAAQWIEMPVLFEQSKNNSTNVVIGGSTPLVDNFAAGVRAAHLLGYNVFLVPLMAVRSSSSWAGTINFKTKQQFQAWFNSYWNIYKPYVQAAADNGVEQLSLGTELELLERTAPQADWDQLITQVRAIYHNTLTYDMNFSTIGKPLPAWFSNANLNRIGISTYFQLVNAAKRVNPTDMPALWHSIGQKALDGFADRSKKKIFISEFGYRNSSDALYQTWNGTSPAPADPQEQSAAYDTLLTNVMKDPKITGTFAWGWDDVQEFAINGLPVEQVIYKHFTA